MKSIVWDISKRLVVPFDAEKEHSMKLTAAILARFHIQYLKENGDLPAINYNLSAPYPMCGNSIYRQRGADITLTPDEQIMYDYLIKSGHFT